MHSTIPALSNTKLFHSTSSSQLKGLVNGTSPSEWQVSRRFCQPKKACDAFNLTNAAASEAPIDFYFLSELRLAVLHVLGLISWKWY